MNFFKIITDGITDGYTDEMKLINLFFYYQRIYRRKKNYRQKIHQQSISVGKLISDKICVLRRRKNSISKTVKSCSVITLKIQELTLFVLKI
jgi:hypothetical protein